MTDHPTLPGRDFDADVSTVADYMIASRKLSRITGHEVAGLCGAGELYYSLDVSALTYFRAVRTAVIERVAEATRLGLAGMERLKRLEAEMSSHIRLGKQIWHADDSSASRPIRAIARKIIDGSRDALGTDRERRGEE